jgi:hypothetical protein
MNMTVKEAADNLLKKGSITQEEYNSIDFEKVSSAFKNIAEDVLKGFSKSNVLKEKLNADPKFMSNYMKLLAGDIKSKAFEDAMQDPDLVDAFNKHITKKNPFDFINKSIKNIWSIPITAGATVVAKEGIIDPLIQQRKINKSFSELSKYTPQLQESDQERIRDYFNVIKTYSPNAAANPLVAGALVNKMMEFGGVDHKLVQDMINIQSGKSNTESIKTMVGGGIKSFSTIPKED